MREKNWLRWKEDNSWHEHTHTLTLTTHNYRQLLLLIQNNAHISNKDFN